ncbi:MAG: energy transducer TonB [Pyrinomonadaceae bacterium]|nr:energy transducer TonB [Pyrinomonadaceae bacterium]
MVMKYFGTFVVILFVVCLSNGSVAAQAGRRNTERPTATYTVPPPDVPTAPTGQIEQDAQDKTIYQCVGANAASVQTASEEVFSSKDVTTKAQILSKPDPAYTLEARRNGTQGTVVLRVLLSSSGRVTSVKVLEELPDGLTENAVKAACRISFKPALKDNRAVAQYIMVKYGFIVDMRIGPRMRRPPFPPRP